MNLTLNHLVLPKRHLIYIVRNEQIYKEQLLITHIFELKDTQYNTAPYSLIDKINRSKKP